MDLISHGIPLGIKNGREYVEIPSASFCKKCEETNNERQPGHPVAPI